MPRTRSRMPAHRFLVVTLSAISALLTQAASAGTLTSTSLTADFNPSYYGQPVTFTATITPSSPGAPGGTVTFSADGGALGSVSLAAEGVDGSVAAGGQHTCAVTAAGGARCWGANASGQLGDGTLTQNTAPVDVTGLASGVASLSLGSDFTCALTTAGGVKCWGHNNIGQLGNSADVDENTPVDVTGLAANVVAVSAGFSHACALTNVGAVKCWGANGDGQLGDGSGIDQLAPVDVVGLSGGVAAISAGKNHTCAVTTAGGAICWGSNAKGSIGDGSSTDRPTPTNVSGLTFSVSAIAASVDFTCAITASGVKCWGDNASKQLGDGTTTKRLSPVPVSGLSGTPMAIATGGAHACMLNSAGALKCWGAGASGQLGNGAIVATSAPVSPTGYSAGGSFAITAGDQHTCTVGNTAALLCWGLNQNGQLGDGSLNLADAPNDVTDFSAGTMLIQYSAKLSVSSLGVGAHGIDAHYDGDSTFDPSDAPQIGQTVNIGGTTTTVGPSPSSAKVGQSVTFHIVVSRILPAVGTPTGTVTIDYGDSTTPAMTTLSGGAANPTHTYAAEGTYNITASYAGDGNFDVSDGFSNVGVTKVASTLTLTAQPNPAKPGQAIAFTARLTAGGTPSGTVTFKEGATTLGSAPVNAKVATLQTASLTIGTHSVQALYSGDTTFTASNGSANATVTAAVGAESRVNTQTTGSQQLPAIARTNNGAIVVWASAKQDGSGYGVYGQRYTATGAKSGAEFKINAATARDQTQPAAAGLNGGGFVAVWQSVGQDSSGLGVYGQRFTAAGAASGPEFLINTTTVNDQSMPAVAGLKAGGFVVAWQAANQDGGGLGIYAQQFSAKGVPVGAEFRVNRTTTLDQSNPAVAALTGGGFVISWQSAGQDGSGFGIYAQRYDANGVKVGGESRVNVVTANDQSLPAVAPTSDGGFVVVWQSNLQDGSGLGVYAQRYSATGARSGGAFRVNTTTKNIQWQPHVAGFSNGGFVIAWTSGAQDGAGQGVFAQAYNGDGSKADVEFQVNTNTTGEQTQPAVAAFASGNFFVVWTSRGQDTSLEGIYSQRFLIPVTP